MKIILKFLLKNITIKPLRTAIIVLCLGAATLAFSLYFVINSSSEELIENQVRAVTGKTDIIVSFQEGFDEKLVLSDSIDNLYVTYKNVDLQIHNIENYKYVQKKQVLVLGVDAEKAYDFEMLPEYEKINGKEAIITSEVALTFGYKEGDIINIPCADGSETAIIIKKIFPCEKILHLSPLTIIVTSEKAAEIACNSNNIGNAAYLDVLDNEKITEAYENLIEKYPDYIINQLMGTDDIKEIISGLANTFFLIFAVVFLMIVFIISAFSKNIVAERMSVIGTLRSLGTNKGGASIALFLECIVYGLMGGILGTVLFYGVKDLVLGNLVSTALSNKISYSVPFYIPLLSIFLSAVLSCVCSFAAISGTAKKSIKDIIFATKDMAYKPSVIMSVLGVVIFVASFILIVRGTGFAVKLIALVLYMLGICLIIPFLISGISKLVMQFTKGSRFPIMRLSLIQLGSKKTLISQTVICMAVITLTTAVYILTCSVEKLYSFEIYQCDVVIDELSEKSERYKNIISSEMTESSEFIYSKEETVLINDEVVNTIIFGYDGFDMLYGISDVPPEIGKNEIVMDKAIMTRLGISEGDRVEITFKANSVRPVTMELTVKNSCDSVYYDMRRISILLNLSTYKEIYYDYPSTLLVKVRDTVSMSDLKKLVVDKKAVFKTADKYYETIENEKKSIMGILGAMLVLGFSLAIISAAGNQSVGCEQRKHEFAVLFSAGMSKSQLIKMLLTESLLSVAFSTLVSVLSMIVILKILSELLSKLELEIPIYWDIKGIALFIVIISGSIILTVLGSIRSLVKMNIAEQLKQE